ncbi:PRC-barrel domain-containing protein [Flexivirga lutea]
MRAVDLLGLAAVDTAGRSLGKVHDVRLETGAPPTPDSGEPAFAISALLIGKAGYAHRLGYGRGQMAGPWPLTSFFRRMANRSVLVPWSDVTEVGTHQVTVRIDQREHNAAGEGT